MTQPQPPPVDPPVHAYDPDDFPHALRAEDCPALLDKRID